jgi:diaminopropionate ammonia-lyase
MSIIEYFKTNQAIATNYPQELSAQLSREHFSDASAEIKTWPGYQPTPLYSLAGLSEQLALGEILYKDESERFSLNSFKALGGAYAVKALAGKAAPERPVFASATDGNHGRSVAWGAQVAGCKSIIFIHKDVSEAREQALYEFAAEVVRVDGNYDASVAECAEQANKNGWTIVSDTTWPGYMEIPKLVMAGYGVMIEEVLDETEPSHVFVQSGVGGLLAAVTARFWQSATRLPTMICVESSLAPCILKSARNNQASNFAVEHETVMAGLSCGETSHLAWSIISEGVKHFITIDDSDIGDLMRGLNTQRYVDDSIIAGESAVGGLSALIGVMKSEELRDSIGLNAESRVLILGTEGATDPVIYQQVIEGKML